MATQNNKKEIIEKVKGMRDVLSEEYLFRKKIIEKAESIATFYGFEPIQTPHLEKVELFTASVGESTDIVEKEMYELKTKGGKRLVLRPEGTAPIMRAYLRHGMQNQPQPIMLYYHGSFFRHEKPQRGRQREFQQFGIEILGEADAITDAIVIKTLLVILEEAVGIKPISVRLNSIGDIECRKIYQKELLAYYKNKTNELCKDCKNRMKSNPLRLLDCKNENCEKIKQEAPQIINFLCPDCTAHFKDLLEILDTSEISYYLDHYLVRGLDYYSRTAFEFFIEDNSEETEEGKKVLELGGGGRYDSLSKILSNKNIPGVGGAIGIDRAITVLSENKKISVATKTPKIFFIQLGANAKYKSLVVLEMLRKAKISVKHSLSKNSLKSQLKIAAKLEVPYVLILGQKESTDNTIIIRDMKTTSQEIVPITKLTDKLKKKLK
ncbi:MAG: histidine--tRNA ligase [Candidatus Marinimicrobia bacterium]|nr:histidine--tRNA ligase [Candidatus Neomarinimicrobiota bacterium]